jgi:hypothetical protein
MFMRSLIILTLLYSLSACGPVIATSNIVSADAALEEARLLNAQRFAPYWYHSAELFLKKARELDGHSEYQFASEFAGLALVRATKALDITRRRMHSRPAAPQKRKGSYEW